MKSSSHVENAFRVLPEADLVVALCRTPISQGDRVRAESLISPAFDWDRFFKHASLSQVEPATMTNLAALAGSQIPTEVRDRANEVGVQARAAALSRTLVMNNLLGRFEDAGVPVILVKGPATGITGYGDPSMRSFGDIDFMVRRQDIGEARELLLGDGFVREYQALDEARLIDAGHALEFSGTALKVELHWSLLSRYLRVPFKLDAVWDSSLLISWAGRDIRVLAPEVQFVFLCAHGTKHEWMQLRWICDVAQLSGKLTNADFDRVTQLARTLRVERLLAFSLGLTRTVFRDPGIAVCIKSLHEAGVQSRINRILEHIGLFDSVQKHEPTWLRRAHPSLPTLLLWIALRENRIDQLGCAMAVLTGKMTGDKGWVSQMTRPARVVTRAIRRIASTQ